MVVYIEKLILIDFLICYLFLFIICKMFSIKLEKKFILILLIFNTVNILLFSKLNEVYMNFKMILPLLNVYIIFHKQKLSKILQISCLFCFLYFLLGGFNLILQVYVHNLYFSVFVICVVLLIFFEFVLIPQKNYMKIKEFYYDVSIEGNSIRAFLDTGNLSHDLVTNLPIVYINKRLRFPCKKVGSMPISTISQRELIDLYEIKDFQIGGRKKDCMVAFVDMEFDCIIGLNLLN